MIKKSKDQSGPKVEGPVSMFLGRKDDPLNVIAPGGPVLINVVDRKTNKLRKVRQDSREGEAFYSRARRNADRLRAHAVETARANPVKVETFTHSESPILIRLNREIQTAHEEAAKHTEPVIMHVFDRKTGQPKEITQAEYLARQQGK